MPQGKVNTPFKLGIIGAGFSGTALLAVLHKLDTHPVEVILFEKTGTFGAGQAYKTPFPYHLLNARACDMSAFEDNPMHFSDWLEKDEEASHYLDKAEPISEQFAPRFLYRRYLQFILDNIRADTMGKIKVTLCSTEVIDMIYSDCITLLTTDGQRIAVDKVVLALGVTPPGDFPFPVASGVKQIVNPWDYQAVQRISAEDSVLIIGTGLSMIDAVLTLNHQQHRGKVTAVSRRGLLPLAHASHHAAAPYEHQDLPVSLRALTRYLRAASKDWMAVGGDWRTLVNSLRHELPSIWRNANMQERKRFLRHVLPYWNIHRHRVHSKVTELLTQLRASGHLSIYGGRVIEIANRSAHIRLRQSQDLIQVGADWVINCMGFSQQDIVSSQPLIASLLKQKIVAFDSLQLGFTVTENYANRIYTLGPPAQGEEWETIAVPEIRKQCVQLATHLLTNV